MESRSSKTLMRRIAGTFVVLFGVLSILGTGGGGGGGGDGTTGGTGGTGGDGTGGTGDTTTVRAGSFSGATFNNGVISAGLTNLSAGGNTSLTVNIVDQTGALYTGTSTVSFNSPCISAGTSTVTPGSVTTTSGTVTTTYQAAGCAPPGGGPVNDLVTATVSANSQTLSATVTLTVQPSTVGSIEFVSADPNLIGIKGAGSGLPEQSKITFRVLDTNGDPVSGLTVNFSLNNTAGGITLTDASDTSGADGLVDTTVLSGNVATVVRVTANAVIGGTSLSSQSSELTISTAIPDQNSFSISATSFNVRGFNFNGTIVPISIFAADHTNNPVPDGTAISFRTEGGKIVSSCLTSNGECTVNWTSQNPRPADGRTTIIATAEGEESFIDDNANGRFDDTDPFDDLPEAFLDANENNMRDAGTEEFIDFNNNGLYDGMDGNYNGLLCNGPTLCDPTDPPSISRTIHVRDSIVIVMSGDNAVVTFTDDIFIYDDDGVTPPPVSPLPTDVTDLNTTGDEANTNEISFDGNGEIVTVFVIVRDGRNQPMPKGTTVVGTTSIGSMVGTASFTVPNTSIGLDPADLAEGENVFRFLVGGPDCSTTPPPGALTVTVTHSGLPGQPINIPARCGP